MRGSLQVSYSVLKALRFAGRSFGPGDVFDARRLDPNRTRLRHWIATGVLGPLGQEPEPEPEPEEPEQEEELEEEEPEAEDDESEAEEV